MIKRKYSWPYLYNGILMWKCFFLNFFKNFLIWIPAVILLIIGIWIRLCLYIGFAVLLVNIVFSFMTVRDVFYDVDPNAYIETPDDHLTEKAKLSDRITDNQSDDDITL